MTASRWSIHTPATVFIIFLEVTVLNATPFSFAFFSQTARRTAEVTTQDGKFHSFIELAQPP
jgi:hypothetical protein